MVEPECLYDRMLLLGLNDDELEAVAKIAERKNYTAGEMIAKEGEMGDRVYLIDQGKVEIIKEQPDGKVQQLNVLSEEVSLAQQYHGGFFGEMSLLDAEPRSASVRALTDCSIIELKNMDLREIFVQNRNIQLIMTINVARILSRRLRETNAKMA